MRCAPCLLPLIYDGRITRRRAQNITNQIPWCGICCLSVDRRRRQQGTKPGASRPAVVCPAVAISDLLIGGSSNVQSQLIGLAGLDCGRVGHCQCCAKRGGHGEKGTLGCTGIGVAGARRHTLVVSGPEDGEDLSFPSHPGKAAWRPDTLILSGGAAAWRERRCMKSISSRNFRKALPMIAVAAVSSVV